MNIYTVANIDTCRNYMDKILTRLTPQSRRAPTHAHLCRGCDTPFICGCTYSSLAAHYTCDACDYARCADIVWRAVNQGDIETARDRLHAHGMGVMW